MSTTSAPFGFRPVQNYPGTTRPNETPDAIVSGYGTAIYIGQPIKISAGYFQPIAATSDKIYGVFAGVKYLASLTSSAFTYGYWAASSTSVSGSMSVYYYDDVNQIYEVQANGSAAYTTLGTQVLGANLTSGSTTTGLFQGTVVSTTVAGQGQGQWLVVGVQQAADNAWGDNYTILRVKNAYSQVYPSIVSL